MGALGQVFKSLHQVLPRYEVSSLSQGPEGSPVDQKSRAADAHQRGLAAACCNGRCADAAAVAAQDEYAVSMGETEDAMQVEESEREK